VPPLFEALFVDTVKTRFRSFNLTLPTVASTGRPANIGQFLAKAPITSASGSSAARPAAVVGTSTLVPKLGISAPAPKPTPTVTPMSVPPGLFRAASNEKADVDFQIESNNEVSSYIDKICHAIVGAHDNWRYTAHFTGVQVNAIMAMGGSIRGPLLSQNMMMYGPQTGLWGNAAAYTRAIADGLATCWREWEQSVRVPGLPWYPAFATFPMPSAPPTPNVPTPMSMLLWSPEPLLPATIATTITRKFGLPGPYSNELFTSIATGFSTAVARWFPMQLVTQVMGKGPVPTYAPPYVPVGPVVAGGIIEASPHFAT
jgi:hypothetical protein